MDNYGALVGYGGAECAATPIQRNLAIAEMVKLQLEKAEKRVEELQKLQILFAQNPALESCLNLMRSLQIG